MSEVQPILITIPEAARRLAICTNKAWQLVRRGELPSVRLGRSVRVSVVSLEQFIAEREQERAG